MENFQKWPIFWANFGRLEKRKYKSHITLISMDWKRNYPRLWQCKKPHEKRHIWRDIANFSIVCKKWPIFWANFRRLEKRKYKSHITLISMDWKRNFQSILIRVMCDLYFLFSSLPKFAQKIGHFWKFSYGPPFAILPKMAILHTI